MLQVSFNKTHLISAVQVQGRYDNGRGQEYTEEFEVEYWREGFQMWRKYYRFDGKSVSQSQKQPVGPTNLFLEQAGHPYWNLVTKGEGNKIPIKRPHNLYHSPNMFVSHPTFPTSYISFSEIS